MLCEGCYRISIVWWSNASRVDAYTYENGGEKISVFKNIRIRVDGALGITKKIGSLRLHAAQAYSRHIFEHKINV